ncbi:hypothetical protein KIF59_16040 [Enterobacter cloacae subsp. cloacae]|nr:hypothetical protein [Enterobacter cloacae subsp. cloacae]
MSCSMLAAVSSQRGSLLFGTGGGDRCYRWRSQSPRARYFSLPARIVLTASRRAVLHGTQQRHQLSHTVTTKRFNGLAGDRPAQSRQELLTNSVNGFTSIATG